MAKSTVKELAVYRNECFITRQGTVELRQGKQNVVLDILDGALDTTTLSLSLPEGLKGSNVQVEPLNQEEQEEILTEINNRLKEIDNRISIKQKQIEMWNTNADFSGKDTLSINEMSEYIEKLPERLEKIYAEIDELDQRKKKLEKERKEKNRQANSYHVRADIEADADGQYPFLLKYKDYRANWYPVYEIHTLENDELSILLKARINQYMEEDLNGTRIVLYTANPSMSSDIPVLIPLKLDFYTRQSFRKMSNFAAGSAPMMVDEEVAEYGSVMDSDTRLMKAVVAPTATGTKEDTMIRYELDGVYDVKNGKELILDLESRTIPCRYHVIAIPKLSDCGYLAANVDVNDISQLTQSSATIYHNNSYIGEICLDPESDSDTYDISLGRDETIRLRRKENRKYTSNVLLKGTKKTDYEYELSVSSTKDKPCKVTLYDQVPVSQDKAIVVDINDISKAALEEESGKLTWEFELGANESRTFDLAYSISFPKEKKINI